MITNMKAVFCVLLLGLLCLQALGQDRSVGLIIEEDVSSQRPEEPRETQSIDKRLQQELKILRKDLGGVKSANDTTYKTLRQIRTGNTKKRVVEFGFSKLD